MQRRCQRRFSLKSLYLSFPDNIDVCRTLIEAQYNIIYNQLFDIEELKLLFHSIDESQLRPVMTNVSQFLNHLFSRRNKTVRHFILKLGNIHKIHDDHSNDYDYWYNYSERLALSKKLEEEADEKIFGVLTDFNTSGLKFLHVCLPLTDDYIKYLQVCETFFVVFFCCLNNKALFWLLRRQFFALLPIKIYKKAKLFSFFEITIHQSSILAFFFPNAFGIMSLEFPEVYAPYIEIPTVDISSFFLHQAKYKQSSAESGSNEYFDHKGGFSYVYDHDEKK
ncbi:hypothetical protein RFI_32558 [Reticulomyxa filosa]|uniref:Uncharacterized protein n=1 Tax=Reticulomyxa filosa TaxID=46433 RepID=X6LSH2_RETFI|nr:hypothetical protein RFI_32558 [Reticulomyxa filosa]|eukprot:ETO04838.1 hypothetical protein RFI_32558 [Reticulomyxa filosa]